MRWNNFWNCSCSSAFQLAVVPVIIKRKKRQKEINKNVFSFYCFMMEMSSSEGVTKQMRFSSAWRMSTSGFHLNACWVCLFWGPVCIVRCFHITWSSSSELLPWKLTAGSSRDDAFCSGVPHKDPLGTKPLHLSLPSWCLSSFLWLHSPLLF